MFNFKLKVNRYFYRTHMIPIMKKTALATLKSSVEDSDIKKNQIDKLNISYTSELFDSLNFLETFKVEQEDILKVIN